MNSHTLVWKIWHFCHTLRDDGVGYGGYLEQLTYLLHTLRESSGRRSAIHAFRELLNCAEGRQVL